MLGAVVLSYCSPDKHKLTIKIYVNVWLSSHCFRNTNENKYSTIYVLSNARVFSQINLPLHNIDLTLWSPQYTNAVCTVVVCSWSPKRNSFICQPRLFSIEYYYNIMFKIKPCRRRLLVTDNVYADNVSDTVFSAS